MSCFKQLTIAASTTDQFTPLHSAVYVPSTGKILGTSENYVMRFNGTTGALEIAVKAISPAYGNMWIGLVNGVPWISCNCNPAEAGTPESEHLQKDLFKLNATTLEADTGGIGLPALLIASPDQWNYGPTQLIGVGDRIYFLFPIDDLVTINYIDSTAPATYDIRRAATYGMWTEQFGTDGTTYIYTASSGDPSMKRFTMALPAFPDDSPTVGYYPVAAEWVTAGGGHAHGVCGSKWLVRVDDWAAPSNTYIDLESEPALVTAGITGIKPIRLRYNSVDSLLYIPVQNKDGVIVYDPTGAAPTLWKSGFDSPIDCVFTPTKKFAVQSGLVGLKEIT